ncbi:MAG: DNA repair protein RecO, partial [Pseudomonadota bacterium]
EADLIVNFLTAEFGKVSGLARHGRKSRQRFGNLLAPGTLAELVYTHIRGRDLVRLEGGDLIECFENLGSEVGLLTRAGLALELAEAFAAPLDPAPELFRLLIWCLERLDRNLRPDETLIIYKLKLLTLAGFGPHLTSCAVCGRPAEEIQAGSLKTDQSGLACRDCAPGGFPITSGTRKIVALVQSMDLEKVDRVRLGRTALEQADPFLMAYFRHLLGRELKASRVLEQIAPKPVVPTEESD